MNAKSPARLQNAALAKIANQEVIVDNLTGSAAYEELARHFNGADNASKYLLSLGIAGIKYLDATSRTGHNFGDGSYNYVVFDDTRIRIKQVDK
jgi:hypothetical protein